MFKKLKKYISLDNPFRLLYHLIRAVIANIYYGFPSKNMLIIGVTGTNGKTTTSNIIAKGLKESGKKIFMFSTVNIIIGDNEYINYSKMTSPDVFELQRLFKIAKKEGCKIAIIETASHGIKMHRVWGLNYDIAVLTNISIDHLDLHKTMKDYVNTKLKLFSNLISSNRKPGIKKIAVVNNDCDYCDLFLNETYDSLYTYGNGQKSNIKALNIINNINGINFDVDLVGKNINIQTKLIGLFNIDNILASIGVFIALGIDQKKISKLFSNISGIPGRMEVIDNNEGFKVIVDYAHTPDALEKVLYNLRLIENRNNIIIVFGATGDRDKTKRPIMGEIVTRLSDKVILTQDDDYSEKTEEILKDVLSGISREEGEDFWIILNRKDAIRTALLMAEKNDILIIAGKGDEHSMITNHGPIEWHDKNIINSILKDMDDNKIVT